MKGKGLLKFIIFLAILGLVVYIGIQYFPALTAKIKEGLGIALFIIGIFTLPLLVVAGLPYVLPKDRKKNMGRGGGTGRR